MTLAVSTARVDITPPAGYNLMGGYGTQTGPRHATGTYSPLYARAVVLWDSGTPRVIVSVDTLTIPASLAAQIRDALPELPAADLMLLASHTHNGPVLPGSLDPYIAYGITSSCEVDAYGQVWVGQVVSVVQAALVAPRCEVTLDYQVASQTGARNRAGLSYVESAVPVLTARDAAGQPVVVAYSYGCHPVAAGNQSRWDPDYPGVASAVIEAAIPGSTAIYLPGPAGDQDPTGARGWGLRSRLGAQLGSTVVAAATTPGRAVDGPISTMLTTVSLPLDVTPTAPNLAAVRSLYAARIADPSRPAWVRRHAERMIAQIDAGTYATTVAMPVQRWRLTGLPRLQLCMVGGELVSGYGVWARNQHGGTNGLVIGGYAAGGACYVPSNQLLPPLRSGGSYEGGWDTDAPGIAGGSQTVYGHLGRFRSGTSGVESAVLAALNAALT